MSKDEAFTKWLGELAVLLEWPADKMAPDGWRESFAEGMTPAEALEEDWSNA